MNGPDVMVSVSGLKKSFERDESVVNVLNGIDFEIYRGEAVGIVGMSGAGKSTLLYILGALEHPTSGSVIINGTDLTSLKSDELAHFRNRHLGFIFQFHHLLPEFSVLENTMMPALINRVPEKEAIQKAEDVLSELGLSHRLTHKAGEISGGEQQRVAIARAAILGPSLLLADEPTGNLDKATGRTVEDILVKLNKERGMTMLMVTHNERLAYRMDRVIRITDGSVEAIENGQGTR
jgi:lipoprotein-releasing system ATP-binding protein